MRLDVCLPRAMSVCSFLPSWMSTMSARKVRHVRGARHPLTCRIAVIPYLELIRPALLQCQAEVQISLAILLNGPSPFLTDPLRALIESRSTSTTLIVSRFVLHDGFQIKIACLHVDKSSADATQWQKCLQFNPEVITGP